MKTRNTSKDSRNSQLKKNGEEQYNEDALMEEEIRKTLDRLRLHEEMGMENLKEKKAIALASTAFEKPHDNDFLPHCATGRCLTQTIEEKNYDSIMRVLHKLSLPKGFSLKVEEATAQLALEYRRKYKLPIRGLESKIFLEADGNTYDGSEIWNYIHVENSIYGAWNAYLLYRIKHTLPLYWHAAYDGRIYVYDSSVEDMPILRADESVNLEPDVVEVVEGKYYVRCCYWDYDNSLRQEIVEVVISNNRASFKDIGQKCLFKRKRRIFL